MASPSNKRLQWPTYIRAICMIFVFLNHIEHYSGMHFTLLDKFYLPFYVNAFFITSGFLLFNKIHLMLNTECRLGLGGGKKLISNILFKMIVPSFIFSTIFVFPKLLYLGDVQWSEIIYKTIGGHTYWFTSALALGQLIISLLIFKVSRNIIIIYIISLAISIVPLCISMGNFDPWYYQEGLNCVGMVATGGIFYMIANRLKQWSSGWIIFILCIAYLIGITYIPGIKSLVYGCDINALGYVFAIISFIVLVKLMDSMPKFKLFDYIGNNSIVFYFFSGIYPALFGGQLSKIASLPPIVVLLLSLIMSIAAATLTTMLIMRYCPWFTDLRKLKTHKNS